MPKKKWTDEERVEFGARMKAAKAARLKQKPVEPKEPKDLSEATVTEDKPDLSAMQAQIDEVMETNALLKAALLNGNNQTNQNQGTVTPQGVIGEVEKYTLDPDNYPDPTSRLAAEPKLVQAINFPFNYELDYRFRTRPYVTKAGVNMIEPEFMVQLNRIVIDDNGEQTNKRYVVRRWIFHEDPQAALVIARENNIEVDESDQRLFLNEMRYLRIRDSLFDLFWPAPTTDREEITEEAIGGTIVQVFTKASKEESEIPFDMLKSKLV